MSLNQKVLLGVLMGELLGILTRFVARAGDVDVVPIFQTLNDLRITKLANSMESVKVSHITQNLTVFLFE